MTPAQIAIVAAEGYSTVCATCRHLHRARAGGRSTCGQETCGGPFVGRDFPNYEGPISDFSRWCFVCGESAKYAAVAAGSDRRFGLCKDHVRAMEEYRARGADGSEKVVEEVQTPGGLLRPDQLLGKRPKSLFAEIAKVEKEFSERGGA